MISIIAIAACVSGAMVLDGLSYCIDAWWRGFAVAIMSWCTASVMVVDLFRHLKKSSCD